jgi:hypothetical protein
VTIEEYVQGAEELTARAAVLFNELETIRPGTRVVVKFEIRVESGRATSSLQGFGSVFQADQDGKLRPVPSRDL